MGFDGSMGEYVWGSAWAAWKAAVHHYSEGEDMLPVVVVVAYTVGELGKDQYHARQHEKG